MNERRNELMIDYEMMQYAILGKFGSDCKCVEFEGIQRIPFGDNLEINKVDSKRFFVNLTLHDSDDSVNSAIEIKHLSDDMIEEIIRTVTEIILTA